MANDFIKILKERGYLHQLTAEESFSNLAAKEKIIGYIGFDCTAKSLHVGSLIQIMMLRILQQCGHQPIVLMGGGTTKVGDPSGKDEARKMLSVVDINENKVSLQSVFAKFIDFGTNAAVMADNAEWLDNIGYVDFLREYGKHFSVNRMLGFDSVKLRLEREQNLSFLEFNYMLLQAYDFVELYKRYGCRLQMGGSDQWGNIVNGVDLARRLELPEIFGITSNLITTSSGAKMGKTASGAIWLNADMLSAYDYWQFWRNTEDADVERFLKMFTELPLSEITKLAALRDKEINEAKIILANEATSMCHGREAATNAYETARRTFDQGGGGEDLPTYQLSPETLKQGISLFKILHLSSLASSGGEAKRLVQGGGVRINNQPVNDEMYMLSRIDFKDEVCKISVGRKKHLLVVLQKNESQMCDKMM